jgi:thiosulfate dehydrogenase [quinone] large subunit
LRIYLGVIFVVAAVPKVRGGFVPGLNGFLHHVALQKAPDFYRGFVEHAVLPHVGFFGLLIPWTELTIGVTLILGLGTRLSAAAALVLLMNYMLAKGAWPWYPSSNDAAWAAVSLALILGAAGRTFGVDAMLARRWSRSPLW